MLKDNTTDPSVGAFNTFHPAVHRWFQEHFGAPTSVQQQGWAAIASGQHTLITAPTGAGKTLAAFLRAINDMIVEAESGTLDDRTRIVYVSPLKALGNDVERNLKVPLSGIAALYHELTLHDIKITTAVRNGDTPSNERARMVRTPPHILVTTPEGLYALVTSKSGRAMLGDVRTVIVDEIHALASDLRGVHLSVTLERLRDLVGQPFQRIGLSATQKPIEDVACFLVGSSDEHCIIVEQKGNQQRDIRIETPGSPLEAVMSNEVWEEVYDRIAAYAETHRTTLVFVNSRRLCERAAHHIGLRVGAHLVAAHHGSLSTPLRHHAEQRLKAGELKVLVATASLELGIDIGDVDLVIQLGATKRIAMLLQRIGRANHWHGGVPRGRLMPLSRDELVECVALMRCVDAGELDRIHVPEQSLDVLAQQIVAAAVSRDWQADEIFALIRRAYPYRELPRDDFESLLDMLSAGFPTEHGRRGTLIHYDRMNGIISARKRARMVAFVSGGTIPESGDYPVRLQPQGVTLGAIAEDFAIYQFPGNILQLGSTTWRIVQVRDGIVDVESAPDEAPYMPVWFGELPARSTELSAEISRVRQIVRDAPTVESAVQAFAGAEWLQEPDAQQLVDYLKNTERALKAMPKADTIVTERFIDSVGAEQMILHAPVGVRINRAWGLALRHVLGLRFGFSLQAAATDDALLLSLPPDVHFTLSEVFTLVNSSEARAVVTQSLLDVPMFRVHWRRVAGRALVVPRQNGVRRVAPHIQRTHADELLLSVFPEFFSRSPHQEIVIPNHPLVRQTVEDCLYDAMDINGLADLLHRIEIGDIAAHTVDTVIPSPAAYQVIVAKPPSFLDNVPLADRHARNISRGPRHLDVESDVLISPEAVVKVEAELKPDIHTIEDLADYLSLCGVLTDENIAEAQAFVQELETTGRARRFQTDNGRVLWAASDQMDTLAPAFPELGTVDADPVTALASVLRGHLETSPPISADVLAAAFGRLTALTGAALERLQSEGLILRGFFDPAHPDRELWCDRRVLSRIHRLTRNQLRGEIEPVTLQQLYRFLLRWQGLAPDAPKREREGLLEVLTMLDGLEVPATLWESEVLPARIAGFRPSNLDDVFLSGQFGWGKLSLGGDSGATRRMLSHNTPIAIYNADNNRVWRSLLFDAGEQVYLSPDAERLLATFRTEGPNFIDRVTRASGLMESQVETALQELVATGVVTADGFAGLRALVSESSRRYKVSRLDMLRRANAGRWAIVPQVEALADPVKRNAAVETYARTVLRRYGVVVRQVINRERSGVGWLELLRVLRRMEARGEVRGGYFVDGVGGEQFALPEALNMLREIRQTEARGELVSISAADPLNLTAALTDDERISSRATARLLLRDAVPIAVEDRKKTTLLNGYPCLNSEERKLLQQSAALKTGQRLDATG